MATTTGIEWTDKTYNPWIGCTRVSPGCKHCYAEKLSLQKGFVSKWGAAGERKITKTALDPEKWNSEALDNQTRYTVFCASLSDVFEDHPALPAAREDLWRLVKRTPFLDWMILTKRAENIAKMLPPDWGTGYDNVCLMVSVENQKFFDSRVPILRAVPAKFRALSIEPLVGHLQIPAGSLKGIDLVIVGGESDQAARPMNPDWVRHIRDACARDGVDFFFKQWGNWTPDTAFAEADLKNAAVFKTYESEAERLGTMPKLADRQAAVKAPGHQVVYYAKSKKTTGSELDGREHKAHPFLVNRSASSTTIVIPSLSPAEKADLSSLESVVTEGLKSFWEAGKALREIRDRGLYRDSHDTFEDYCADKWDMSRAEAYRHIGAASVVEDLTVVSSTVLPTAISQTRPLMKLKTPAERRQAWGEVTKTGCAPTASAVEDAVVAVQKSARKPVKAKASTASSVSVVDTKTTAKYPLRAEIEAVIEKLTFAVMCHNEEDTAKELKKLDRLVKRIEA